MSRSTQSAPNQSPAGNRAWRATTLRRWTHLQQAIALQERRLARSPSEEDREAIRYWLRALKRAALSVWLDAKAEGLQLSSDESTPCDRGPGHESAGS